MAAVVDSHWQLYALAVSVSGAGSGWLASVVDVGDIYLLTIFLFAVVFSVPAINLCLNAGYVSGHGPVRTFGKMAPIASGVGWALVFLVGEKLFYKQLLAAQNLLYIFFSIRPSLNWALNCSSVSGSSHLCFDFKANVTEWKRTNPERFGDDDQDTRYPQNHWPAQEFNRYFVRGDILPDNESLSFAESWYFGTGAKSTNYSVGWPPFLLTLAHFLIWAIIFGILYKFGQTIGHFALRYFVIVPLTLLAVLTALMLLFGLEFDSAIAGIASISGKFMDNKGYHYQGITLGTYQATLSIIDSSTAFTGILILLASWYKPRTDSGFTTYAAVIIAGLQLVGPILMAVLRKGCLGHLKNEQPSYVVWHTTDEEFSFDTFPVCAATSRGGPLWALMYYVAQFLYAVLGPMVIWMMFVHASILEGFPQLHRHSTHILAVLCAFFSTFGLLLCMPLGSTVAMFFGWISQSAIPEIFALITILFVYGWTNFQLDVALVLGIRDNLLSIPALLFGPTSTFFTVCLFTTVPAFLATKFVSVFDYLPTGGDVFKHVDHATSFLSSSQFFNRAVGYSLLLIPIGMIIYGALSSMFTYLYRNRLPWSSIVSPALDWQTHSRLESDRQLKRSPPLSHRMFVSFCFVSYRTALFIIFVLEIVVTIVLFALTIIHTVFVTYSEFNYVSVHRRGGNFYRTALLSCLTVGQLYALYQLRQALKLWDGPSRLTPYIAIATLETAFLNGYAWTVSFGYHNELLMVPVYVVLINTLFRGLLVSIVIAARWNMRELSCRKGGPSDDDQASDTWSQQVTFPDNTDLIPSQDDLIMDDPRIV